MNEEEISFLATIYGEAAQSSTAAWKAIASVIMNRVGVREWKKHKTPFAVLANTGFDAFTQRNAPYKKAVDYFRALSAGTVQKTNLHLKFLAEAVLPIYKGEEKPFPEIILYFSPHAQRILHAKNPKLYTRPVPKWALSPLVELVNVPGCEEDDFAFYRYKV